MLWSAIISYLPYPQRGYTNPKWFTLAKKYGLFMPEIWRPLYQKPILTKIFFLQPIHFCWSTLSIPFTFFLLLKLETDNVHAWNFETPSQMFGVEIEIKFNWLCPTSRYLFPYALRWKESQYYVFQNLRGKKRTLDSHIFPKIQVACNEKKHNFNYR